MPVIKKYKAPSGAAITGTLERLIGEATVIGIHPDGTPEYAGETKVFWNDQRSETTPDGKRIFLDENGVEWTFDQLVEDGDA